MGRHQKVDKEGGLKWEGIITVSCKHAFFDRAEYWECRSGNWGEKGEKFRPSGQNGREAQCLLSANRPLSPTPTWSNYRQARASAPLPARWRLYGNHRNPLWPKFILGAILQISSSHQAPGAKSLPLLLKHQLQCLNKHGQKLSGDTGALEGLNGNAILFQNNLHNI